MVNAKTATGLTATAKVSKITKGAKKTKANIVCDQDESGPSVDTEMNEHVILHIPLVKNSELLGIENTDTLSAIVPDDFSSPTQQQQLQQQIQQNERLKPLMSGFESGRPWPSSTSCLCFHCCHGFTTLPIGLPKRLSGQTFIVWGIFCSFECAAAFNLYTHQGYEMQESSNLLQLLYFKTTRQFTQIHPAPSRYLLKVFGGALEIDEFRAAFKSSKTTVINMAPLVASANVMVEEICTSLWNPSNQNNVIPLDLDRIKNASANIRLQRSKHVLDKRNTLESKMNLTVKEVDD